MIEIEEIHKSYRDNHVLRGLSFSVPKGHITGLVGPNGSGKSTAIRILTGFSDADSGCVRIGGQVMDVNAVETKRLVGYAPENAPSYRELTVREYLRFIAQIRGVSKANLAGEIDRAVEAFSLRQVVSQAIGTLSKGYRHRVSLAQCLLGDPPVIILDEPTDGLDPIQKIGTRKMILELAESKAVLLTTHLLEEVEMLCDRVVAIGQGKVVFSGTIEEIVRAGAADVIVCIRVANCDKNQLQSVIDRMDGLLSTDFHEEGGGVKGQLSFGHSEKKRDILDEVSLELQKQGVRIVELRREDPPLTSIFSASKGSRNV